MDTPNLEPSRLGVGRLFVRLGHSVPVLWTTPSALLCRVNAPADPASAAGRSATVRLSVDGIAATSASAASIFTFLAASATASIDGISPA